MDLDALDANSRRFCPGWELVDARDDDALAAALQRDVRGGCPEPRADERDARWFAVTAIVGVAADDDGTPLVGDDAPAFRVGRGKGVLLLTDRAAALALTEGRFLGVDATAEGPSLAVWFEAGQVADVVPESKKLLGKVSTRGATVELHGESWGVVGLVVHGELARQPGQDGGTRQAADALPVIDRLRALA